jgi:tetratricopeptide (TPR) repeat protein
LEPPDPQLDDALRRLAAGDLAAAHDLARAVATERPGSARAAFLVALALHKQKNYGAALPEFDRAISLGPTFEPFAPVRYFRAWCLYNLGRLAEARAEFEAHLALVPDEGDSRFGLGLIATDEGRLGDAERELTAALADAERRVRAGDGGRRADAAKAHARLADVILIRAHDARDDRNERADLLARARAELEAGVALYPQHYTTWYKLHQVLTELGEDDLAARALQQHDAWKARVRPGSEGLTR